VQDNLGLVELLLDGGDAARLGRVLVALQVILQRGEGGVVVLGVALLVGRPPVVGQELVQDL
jgi:hypothetical protein